MTPEQLIRFEATRLACDYLSKAERFISHDDAHNMVVFAQTIEEYITKGSTIEIVDSEDVS